ncbi:hypothetical protein GGR53DRAFT_531429 [Hypoxylon sp. FL1150]|nr:hypothetical protein GGR53DRAFT_531429 [Hypoxylon sp. FL1150]
MSQAHPTPTIGAIPGLSPGYNRRGDSINVALSPLSTDSSMEIDYTKDPLPDNASLDAKIDEIGEVLTNAEADDNGNWACGWVNCGKSFESKAQHKKHLENYHKMWRCPHTPCSKPLGFSAKSSLIRHMKTVHGDGSPDKVFCGWGSCNTKGPDEDGNIGKCARKDNLDEHKRRVHMNPGKRDVEQQWRDQWFQTHGSMPEGLTVIDYNPSESERSVSSTPELEKAGTKRKASRKGPSTNKKQSRSPSTDLSIRGPDSDVGKLADPTKELSLENDKQTIEDLRRALSERDRTITQLVGENIALKQGGSASGAPLASGDALASD